MSHSAVEIARDLKQIYRKDLFQNQVDVELDDSETNSRARITCLVVTLYPNHGPFENTAIRFRLDLSEYPRKKPAVKCLTKVFHPNISDTGNICFSMFSGDWSNSYRIEHYINGLIWLLANPNHNSPLRSSCVRKNSIEFERCVKAACRGEPVSGTQYESCYFHRSDPRLEAGEEEGEL